MGARSARIDSFAHALSVAAELHSPAGVLDRLQRFICETSRMRPEQNVIPIHTLIKHCKSKIEELIIIIIIIMYSIYRALIFNGPKALYIIKITKS